uniref:Pentatricopeptide repeat protein n=1 Tax=Salvia miltiorrhiza TaxID=226208 RepID=A0A678WDU6_SALMI|nr:pentatricopeptide repeat protein [Salvia miltiorrhiza]
MAPAKSLFKRVTYTTLYLKITHYSSFPPSNLRPHHSSLIKTGSIHFLHVANYLLKLYLHTPDFDCARNLFDEIPQRDVRTWTLLISGLSKFGHHRIALDYFAAMQNQATVVPNAFTLSSVLKCCASIREDGLQIGKAVHGWIITSGIDVDVALDNALLDFYAKLRQFDCVRRFFESMDEKDSTSWNIVMAAKLREGKMEETLDFFWRLPNKSIASWNTIIDGLLQQGLKGEALELLYEMVKLGYAFDVVTFSISLALASSLKNLELGRQTQGRMLRTGMNEDSFVSTSLLDMYCKCREMHKASVVFRELQTRHRDDLMAQTVSWSTMIAGCVQNGMTQDAMRYFRSMILEKLEIDLFTLTTILAASANGALLELGQQIHAHALKLGHKQDVFLCSSMIDMYAKCGKLDDSWSYFRETRTRNVVLWSSMLSSYAMYGLGNEAIQLFELMQKEGIKPNEVSFLGVLTACSHAGLVDDGCKYFKMMTDVYGIWPGIEHFVCMTDLLGRAGHLKEIKDFVYEKRIDHLKEVWKAYLSCCWLHKNVEMANWVSKKLLKLDPRQPDPYLLASNTFSANDVWEEAAKLRGLMLEKEVRKLPGQSWI